MEILPLSLPELIEISGDLENHEVREVLRTNGPGSGYFSLFRAEWHRVSVGFVFLLTRVSVAGRHAAPYGRSGGRSVGGGASRRPSDGASGRAQTDCFRC